MSKDLKKYEGVYSEKGLWAKIKKFAKKAGIELVLNALKLYYAMEMGKATKTQILTIVGALGYFISPIDAVPDLLPGGLIDDASVLAATVALISCCSDKEVVAAAKAKCSEWFD